MSSEEPPIEERVGEALEARGETLAVAESCTGGLLGSRVTDVPGASEYFDRGFVVYSYDAKRAELAVTREALDEHGAVSAPVARQLARGVRDVADVTWGLATTGIAGPTGGTTADPVGTAYVGVAYAAPWGTDQSEATVERYVFDGDRRAVKEQVATRALVDLLDGIEAVEA